MTTLQVSAQKQLRQLIEQIERLEEEKKALAGDIRDKYLEAKAVGFDVKALRKIVSLRKKSQTDRQEEEAILAVYMHALGMIDELPELPAGPTTRIPPRKKRRSGRHSRGAISERETRRWRLPLDTRSALSLERAARGCASAAGAAAIPCRSPRRR